MEKIDGQTKGLVLFNASLTEETIAL